MSSLFRKEAVDHQKENFFGDVLLIQPVSTTLLAWLTAAIAICVVLYVFLGTYTPKQTVEGYLVPDKGLAKLYAPSLSTISEVLVQEGDRVNSGDTLLIGSTSRAQKFGEDLDALVLKELTTSEKELEKKRANEKLLFEKDIERLEAQITANTIEVEQLGNQIALQGERVDIAKQRSDGAKRLLNTGSLSESGYQDQYETYLTQKQQLDELTRQKGVKEAALGASFKDKESTPLQHSSRLSDIDNAISDLHQRRADAMGRNEYALKAPFEGEVTALQVYAGQNVSAGALLLVVMPEGTTLHADLFLPTRAIGFIKKGQQVRLRYAAFPHEKFGIYSGKVSFISKTILLPSELPIPVKIEEPVYRVTVELDVQDIQVYQEALSLQAGMLLNADIMLEKRSLIEWILSPIYNFKGRL